MKETIHELNIPVSTIKMNTQLLEKTFEWWKEFKTAWEDKTSFKWTFKTLWKYGIWHKKRDRDKIDKQEFYFDEIIKKSCDKFDDIKKNAKIFIDVPNIKVCTDLNGFEKL